MAQQKTNVALKVEHKEPELMLVLQSNIFRVPPFQRSYVWGTDQISDFDRDLWEGFRESKTWFVGTLIVAKGEKLGRLGPVLDIIDGQQRLTTLFIWLAALRHQCRERRIEDLAGFIESSYLQDKSPLAPPAGQPRLNIGDGEVNTYFQALVISGAPTREPLHGSEQRILTAHSYFAAKIAMELNASDKPLDELIRDLLEWLRESLHAFVAVAPTVATASKVFDLMNSRGRALEMSDLLKSYLFHVTGGAATSEWASITQRFDPLDGETDAFPSLNTFIRHQWFSRNAVPTGTEVRGVPSQRGTQDLIRGAATTHKDAMEYLGAVRQDAESYVQLARPSQAYWEKLATKGVFEALQELNLVRVDIFRPLMLSVLRRWSPEEQLTLLRSLTSWAFRKKIVNSRLDRGQDERAYLKAAYEASTSLDATKDILALIDVPDDERFAEAFRTTNIGSRQARWVLGRLENVFEGSGERGTTWDQMTLEHILPYSEKKLPEWPAFTPETHRSFRQNIGNLTLLRRVPNESAGNGPFSKKRRVYEASSLLITKSLGASGDWTPDEIKQRAERLAACAVKAWPLIDRAGAC